MRIANPLDFVVMNRNQVLEQVQSDPDSPLYQATERIEAGAWLIAQLLESAGHLAHAFPELDAHRFRRSLVQAAESVAAATNAGTLKRLAARVRTDVEKHAAAQEKLIRAREAEVRDILSLVLDNVRRSHAGGERLLTRAGEVADNIAGLASLEDLRQVREGLEAELEVLRTAVSEAAETMQAPEELLKEVEELRSRLLEVQETAARDALTGAHNRRGLDARLEELVEQQAEFTLVLCDLNRLKQVNDTRGHAMGDECLKAMARQLRAIFRPGDLVARVGGDEFAVVVTVLEKQRIAERIRQVFVPHAADAVTFTCSTGARSGTLSASFGAAHYRAGESVQELFERADQRLYRAKSLGHNIVVTG